MSACLHRYFSHKGFKCGRVTQFALHVTGCLASQGPPLWWASKHRRHHAHCDTPLDPHSPVVYSDLYAWIGWAYTVELVKGTDEEYVQDLMRFPELAMAEHWCLALVLGVHALVYVF